MEPLKFIEEEIGKVADGLDFAKLQGIIPAVTLDEEGRVLMLAFMNREALEKTLRTGMMHYWSRSREKIWMKGEDSKHYQYVLGAYTDCDNDSMLFKVHQIGPACHTNEITCFHNAIKEFKSGAEVLYELEGIIQDRMKNPKEGSYTTKVLTLGPKEAAKKVGEEAIEVAIAALAEDTKRTTSEAADLLYHLILLLQMKGVRIGDVFSELRERRR